MKILVLPLYGIGDVLMTTPAIRNLKERLHCEITYLHMFKTTRDILFHNPHIKENIFFPFLSSSHIEGIRFLLQFRGRFDASINFYPSNRRDYNLAAYIAGSPVRIGHRYVRGDFAELNFLKNRTVREDDNIHNVEENLRLLEFLGIGETKRYPLEICLTDEERMFAGRWLKERRLDEKTFLIGVHPGTSVFKGHDRRRWPEGSFAALLDAMSAELEDSTFLIFGGPEEQELRKKIMSSVRDSGKVFSVDSVSVRQTAALMMRCRLFVSGDSGPMHMAAAMRVPTVAIFGPTDPRWVRPWGVPHRVIRTRISCSPCFRYSSRPLRCGTARDFECLSEVTVERVCEACMELIGKRRSLLFQGI